MTTTTTTTTAIGRWRVCCKRQPAADFLLVRFASLRDVKGQGAQHRSDYYKKHGNPNYSGLQGLISSSLRKRLAGGNIETLTITNNYHNAYALDLRGKLERPDAVSWMRRDKVRAGINVFDNEGKELEWDYEHDTRYFESNQPNNELQTRTLCM